MIKIKYIIFLLLFSFCDVYSNNYYDLKNLKEKIAILQVKDNRKESGASFSLYSTDFSSVPEEFSINALILPSSLIESYCFTLMSFFYFFHNSEKLNR